MSDWLIQADESDDLSVKFLLNKAVEKVALSLYPFLANSSTELSQQIPIADLRSTIKPWSAGIVIPCGNKNVRFGAHLLASLRSVLGCRLPIQIYYDGDEDLSPENRAMLLNAAEFVPTGTSPISTAPNDTSRRDDRSIDPSSTGFNDPEDSLTLEFVDISTIFNDTAVEIVKGGWAMKPFAMLAAPFENVILLDADTVFLQKPEVLVAQPSFLRSGALLYHDRLIWQHAFRSRHDWWKDQIRRPSAQMNKSKVWTEDYAEEGDSGVVVMDKSRVDVLMGLVHACWQNSVAVRDEVTYRMTYGDKETYWMGLEMSGATYEFEEYYASIVGWEEAEKDGSKKVCSFVIAHPDEKKRLLWYNGSLLKNKGIEEMMHEYQTPESWMYDATWQKGGRKQDMSCMVGRDPIPLTEEEKDTLSRSIEAARQLDVIMNI
ncbi:glycosyltransferase family 71 protein [Myriangium duriaei CBS 260.36]|uniref:Glycosyltransferase family 71 protein n=1 Tax=Myriangium duriaei CBS 260.36 TaxID=1168546 RepID=A0A9P4J0Z9_9PEZI|nr:glycosyltransferase family 71 protein [Myriangium duriaei CBS 260.36]